ncbi:TetR/AcrR family transcriptional regulator [Kutzneria kofuensis]|uniref:AcrR family transcriptional regulator n=1 Tax=Kutzneria kofuensis TaxID=103725 RepID=A0A7W9KAX4_9PSEU|nr:TetR/AcrR family transcriptional regulator [Kutzneria kofuensis]MBB5889151.1 AcrR family transcriptional regulator [Kutzneria kofuensis]
MPVSRNSAGQRAPRTDARRNAERILAVAEDVFAAGRHDVPLEEIARRAGVGPATLYRHYPSKDDLIAAVVRERYHEHVAPLLDEADADPDALRGLLRCFEAALEIRAQHLRVVITTRRLTAADNLTRTFFHRLGALLARAQEQGSVRPDLAAADLPRLLAMVAATIPFDDRAGWRRYLVLLADLLRGTPTGPLPPLPAEDADSLSADGPFRLD